MQNAQIVFAQSRAELGGRTPQTLKEAADVFFVTHVRRLSDSYRDWLETRIGSLVAFLGPELPLERITIWQLDLWYSQLADRDQLYEDHPYRKPIEGELSPFTLHGYVRAVRTFFNWLGKRRLIDANPASLLEFPPVPEQPPKHATASEVARLLEHFESFPDRRNFVAVQLLVATGLRAGGLVGLRKADVDVAARLLTTREKGRGGQQKARTVPMDRETATSLAAYMDCHGGRYVFVTRDGGPWSTQGLYQTLRRASDRVLERVVGPHMLRHYFGFESVRRGMSLRIVQLIMGHASSKTTEIYTRFSPLELRDAYDAVYGASLMLSG